MNPFSLLRTGSALVIAVVTMSIPAQLGNPTHALWAAQVQKDKEAASDVVMHISPAPMGDFSTVDFYNPQIGWVTTDDGIFGTHNEGKTFAREFTGNNLNLTAIQAFSSQDDTKFPGQLQPRSQSSPVHDTKGRVAADRFRSLVSNDYRGKVLDTAGLDV